MWLRQTGAFWRNVSPRVVHVRRQIKAFLTRLIQAEFLSAFLRKALPSLKFLKVGTREEMGGESRSGWIGLLNESCLGHISIFPMKCRSGPEPERAKAFDQTLQRLKTLLLEFCLPLINCQLDLTFISYTLKEQMLKLTRTNSNYFKGMIHFHLCM